MYEGLWEKIPAVGFNCLKPLNQCSNIMVGTNVLVVKHGNLFIRKKTWIYVIIIEDSL